MLGLASTSSVPIAAGFFTVYFLSVAIDREEDQAPPPALEPSPVSARSERPELCASLARQLVKFIFALKGFQMISGLMYLYLSLAAFWACTVGTEDLGGPAGCVSSGPGVGGNVLRDAILLVYRQGLCATATEPHARARHPRCTRDAARRERTCARPARPR